MKTIGVLTFHASHNYGSMLQAYALQHVLCNMGYKCEIINFRKEEQKKMYLPIHKKGPVLQRIVRTLTLFPYLKDCNRKYQLFENFLANDLILSEKEYSTLQEIENDNLSYDYYITGSDQIWNPVCWDFDWIYFLPFVKAGRKIAYAPSMGNGYLPDEIMYKHCSKFHQLINQYDFLSVRETGTLKRVEALTNKEIELVLDPTLLVDVSHWENLISKEPLIKGEYIFLYSPSFNLETFDMVRNIASRMKLKVVISQLYGREITYKYGEFVKYLSVGPKEFLNLCKNASLVCGNSFHLIVFSILFKTPFWAINGMNDNRVCELLLKSGLTYRSITKDNFECVINDSLSLDFEDAIKKLQEERYKSLSFLRRALA